MTPDMTEPKTDVVSALDEMERSARGTLKHLAEIEQTVRAGDQHVSRDDALTWLKVSQNALSGALSLIDKFKVTEVQARQATALAAGAGALNEALAEELGKANLRTESALGLVPEPKKRN